MKRLIHQINLLLLVIFSFHVSAQKSVLNFIENSDTNNSCFSYSPYLGEVNNENYKINSKKFDLTDENLMILNENVEIDFKNGLLLTNYANIDKQNSKIIFKNGGSLFLEKYVFAAESGDFIKENESLSLEDGEVFFRDSNLIFNFRSLKGSLEDSIYFENVNITSCFDASQGWKLSAKEIVVNSNKNRGVAKRVKIDLLDRTLIRLPIIPFATSNKRMSGFLEPSLSFSSDGLDFMIPYYKVISDSSDITIAPRNISDRGVGLETNYRKAHGKTRNLRKLDLIYFDEDDEFKKQNVENFDSRWAFLFKDQFNFNNSKVNIDWAKSSDSLVLSDIPGEITSIGSQRSTNLHQNIKIKTYFKNSMLSINHIGFQTLNPILTNGYKKSPEIEFNKIFNFKNYYLEGLINTSYFKANEIHGFYGFQTMNGQYLKLINNPSEGRRTYIQISATNKFNYKNINFKTNFDVKSIFYDLDSSNTKAQNVSVPQVLIDIDSLFFKKEKNNSISLIEPRLVIGYSSYENQSSNPIFDTYDLDKNNQLFNNERFVGMDRIGDQKFYTIGLRYQKIQMGMTKLNMSISQKTYFEDPKVHLKMGHMAMMGSKKGPIVFMSSWMPKMNQMLMGYAGYQNDKDQLMMAGLSYKAKFNKNTFGFAKRYRRMSGDFNVVLNYSEIFSDIKISEKFKFIAKIKRDNKYDKNIETVAGFGYENCCFAFNLTASDKNFTRYNQANSDMNYLYINEAWNNIIEIENKSRINFEFKLKGFNSSFDKNRNLFNNSLFNY